MLPEDAWLTGLTATVPASAAPDRRALRFDDRDDTMPGVTIQGATYSHESVARVLARLAALPSLDGRSTHGQRARRAAAPQDAGDEDEAKKQRSRS